jgi:acyl carrier protein
MYRTGDLGRWQPDGEIGFIGRSDDQVKINGHRIELGEIETVLLRSGVVNAAAVLARANAEGEKELVAYMTGKEGLQASDLRSYLSKYLPAYMVPARFIQLPEFPLTPNGKVDRNKLPEPKGLDLTTGVAYVSPRNEIEEELVAIWQELLGKDKIGIGDNFFDLGGNSIKILRMVMLSNRIFDKKISVAMAFRYPSIGTLAEYLAGGLHGAAGESEKELDKAITVMDETFNILNNDSHED